MKKVKLVALALVASISFAACGSDSESTEAEATAPPLTLPQPTGVVVVTDGAPRAGSDAVRRLLRPARYFNANAGGGAAATGAAATGEEGGEKQGGGDNGAGEALLEAALEAADAGSRSCFRCGGAGHIAR